MGYFSCRRKSAVLTNDSHLTAAAAAVSTTATTNSPPTTVRIFHHDELNSNFSPSSFLGRGSHSSVFLASLDGGHLLAAAKVPSSDNEIHILSSLPRSPLLVNLLGHTPAPTTPRIAIVELMPRGSLHTLLHRSPPNFPSRLRLASQIAAAIASLHSLRPPLIHRDVKPSNVLIDAGGNARLADFGLAVRLHDGILVPPAGTIGYIDPGYVVPADLSTKCDVYSFGVVLLEILSGRRAIDVEYSPTSVVEWSDPIIEAGRGEEIWDPRGGRVDDGVAEAVREVAVLAGKCVGAEAVERPAMEEVAEMLQSVERRLVGSSPAWKRLARKARGGKGSSRNRKTNHVAT